MTKTILIKDIPRKRISKGTHFGYGIVKIEDLELGNYIGLDCSIHIEVREFELPEPQTTVKE